MTHRFNLSLGLGLVGLVLATAALSFLWAPHDATRVVPTARLRPPLVADHLLGTDFMGRDIASQLLVGSQVTLFVGVVAVLLAAVLGVPLGVAAAMGRGWLGELLMRGSDILVAFPALLLAILLAGAFGASTTTGMVAIAIATVPIFARVSRSGALQVLSRDYVTAARIAGQPGWRIALRHVLPGIRAVLLVQASVAFAMAILAEAALSYLGLSTKPPTPSWGRMLREAQGYLFTEPHLAFWPGAAIALTVLGFNLLGDGLRDHLDPRLRRATRTAAKSPAGQAATLAAALPSGDQPVLRARDLSVRIGPTPVVHGVSFELAAGQRLGVIGESGSGKTLTALALLGLLPEDGQAGGSVQLAGRELLTLPERELARIRGSQLAMVFQEPMTALDPVRPVGAQLADAVRLHQPVSRSAARRTAARLLDRVGLEGTDRLRAYPHQLSGGQRQRVVLAMALAHDPAVLVCDEPTTALDVTVQARMLELIDQLVAERDSALLLISHDLAVVARLCEQVLVMYGGRVVEAGPVAEVFGHPRHPYTAALLAASALTTGADGRLLTHQPGGSEPPPGGCGYAERCPRVRAGCENPPPLAADGPDRLVACHHAQEG